MTWKHLLAYISGSVDEELLQRNEYLAAENRILLTRIEGRLRLTDPERITLAKLGKKLGTKALNEVATIVRPATISFSLERRRSDALCLNLRITIIGNVLIRVSATCCFSFEFIEGGIEEISYGHDALISECLVHEPFEGCTRDFLIDEIVQKVESVGFHRIIVDLSHPLADGR
ncbi:MAG: hypothetical protein A2289_23760 [Deltaproteobacteria bacterium RIFOXYA12_FULL_58_15]|nr:MAG: hypothetical protein A2289_23760 [Deltaproteobacteria bacterium RIFOXYA12_FULL_58_15]